MRVGDKLWTQWNKAPMRLWQTQLNFAAWCASSACGVSSAHLNYTKHSMIRAVYRFHVYYHMRRVLKRLQVPLPHETSFNAAHNPYTSSEFLKIYEDYGVPNDPMKYQDEKFYWTYQRGIDWPDDYIGPDSMTQWIIEKSVGFTDVCLFRISESVRAYAYLILSSQASARSSMVGNTVSALTAKSAFLNNFENVVNRRVDIREDIKHYQDNLSYSIYYSKIQTFNLCYRYIDDLIVFNNKKFGDYVKEIYPSQVTVEKTNTYDDLANYLDLTFIIESNNPLYTKLYDKRDDFDFHIVNFPFLLSNISSSPSYGVYISQLIRYARCCSYYDDFGYRHKLLVDRLLSQGYEVKRLRNSFKKFYGRYPDLIGKYQRLVKDMVADSFPD